MALPRDERLMRLRLLVRHLEGRSSPSSERDELLGRIRVRIVEIEALEELGPPSSLPALEGGRVGPGASAAGRR
jgi:hypothetical protein